MHTLADLDVDELPYELNVSPRSSLDSKITKITHPPQQPDATPPPPTPSIRLLFSLIPRHNLLIILLPAVLTSMISGAVAPFMTVVVGQAFNAFAQFASSSPSPVTEATLLHLIGISCLELIALAVGSIALGSLTSCLWIWVGEINAMSVRRVVYQSMVAKDMPWFDLHLGASDQQPGNVNDPVGAAGLMAKFTKFVLFILSTQSPPLLLFFSSEKQMMLEWRLL